MVSTREHKPILAHYYLCALAHITLGVVALLEGAVVVAEATISIVYLDMARRNHA
jgi:hypothetical protein